MSSKQNRNMVNSTLKNAVPDLKILGLFSLVIIIITSFTYRQSLKNNFLTEWDDNVYVTENVVLFKMGTKDYYKNVFTSYVHGNYHPLTILSLGLDYKKGKLDARVYHKTNLELHIINSLLVLLFIWLLCKKIWVAIITSLLFAIHPMHVESVAWISERKDLLYTLFFLASLCFYISYKSNIKNKWIFYGISLSLFVCASFSKGMAVSLPLVLIVLDYYKGDKLSVKLIWDKVPFFVIALIMGLVAIEAQKSGNAIYLYYSISERLMFACYALILYVVKLAAPVNLSAFYVYPPVNSLIVMLSPIIVISILVIVYLTQKQGKYILFGFLFFISTIALVLQVIPVGEAIISERYTYIPYIGLFFIIGYLINNLIEKKQKIHSVFLLIIVLFVGYSVWLYSLTIKQIKVWSNENNLWTSAIASDENCYMCYKNRADYLSKNKKNGEAISDYTIAINLKPLYSEAYNNRGLAYVNLKDYDNALADFAKAVELKPTNVSAINNMGNINMVQEKYSEAINYYSRVLQVNPNYSSYYSRGVCYFYIHEYKLSYEDVIKAKGLGYPVDKNLLFEITQKLNQH
jgi:tetratricopeptide (TPR) repeat protein